MFSHIDKLKKSLIQSNIEKIDIETNLSTKIFILDLSYDIDNQALVEEIKNFRIKYPKSMLEYNKKHTNIRSWHSFYTTHKLTKILDPLVTVQKQKMNSIFREVAFDLYNIWINMYVTNDLANRHNHGEFSISTVYYPLVEKNATPIIFDNNNRDTYYEVPVTPKEGMLLCFPSFIYHKVPTVQENNRISIAANYNFLYNDKIDFETYKK